MDTHRYPMRVDSHPLTLKIADLGQSYLRLLNGGIDDVPVREAERLVREFVGILEEARHTGHLEPLTTILYSCMDLKKGMEAFKPYFDHVHKRMQEIGKDVVLEVVPDEVYGSTVLSTGILIFKRGRGHLVFRYRPEERSVAFERLAESSADLESVIRTHHDPAMMESVIRVRLRKPHHAQGEILPYFAHSLLGLDV